VAFFAEIDLFGSKKIKNGPESAVFSDPFNMVLVYEG